MHAICSEPINIRETRRQQKAPLIPLHGENYLTESIPPNLTLLLQAKPQVPELPPRLPAFLHHCVPCRALKGSTRLFALHSDSTHSRVPIVHDPLRASHTAHALPLTSAAVPAPLLPPLPSYREGPADHCPFYTAEVTVLVMSEVKS